MAQTTVNVRVYETVKRKTNKRKTLAEMDSLALSATLEQKEAAMQEIRDLMSEIDGNSIDLKQIRAERRSSKYECNI